MSLERWFWIALMAGGVLGVLTGVAAWAALSVLPDDPSLAASWLPLLVGSPPLFAAGLFGGLARGRAVRPAIAAAFASIMLFNGALTWASVVGTDAAWTTHVAYLLLDLVLAAVPCAWLWRRAERTVRERPSLRE